MKLLVTNDDGIDSVFLRELVRALLAEGHQPYVVAPRREQSWVGAAKSRNRPVHAGPADRGLGCPTWCVDGTPSDCVNIALDHLVPDQPEAVVSGINVGLNVSLGFIIASGTVAGALEGALHGLPALALSQELPEGGFERMKENGFTPEPALAAVLAVSARHAAALATALLTGAPGQTFVVHNVNFPATVRPDSPVRRTVPAQVVVPRLFSPASDDGTHRLIFRLGEDLSPATPLTDRAALAGGCISHTVLDYTRLGRLAPSL